MYNYVIDGITVNTFLDRRRAYAKGDYPIKVRVNYKGKKRYYSTGKSCTQKVWEKLPTAKSKELVEMRSEIQTSFSIILTHVKQLHAQGNFTIDNLDRSLMKISGTTLNSLLEQKIKQLTDNGQIGTRECYENTLANVTKFGGKQIPIENVTVEWLKEFEAFMLPTRSVATLGIGMRNIRAIMNIAKREKLIKDEQYPFGVGKYEIQTAEGRKKALASPDLKKLKEIDLRDMKLAWFRDLFLFVFYCNGINVADLILLKYKNIENDELYFIREKTRRTSRKLVPIRVVITSEMWTIIRRWGNPVAPDNYIFNTIEHTDNAELHYKRKQLFLKQFNQKMKIIGATIGIYNITTYTARHSFATILKRKGVNIAYISESLGHTSLNTTQAYLDSFEIEERRKNAQLLSEL